MSGALAVGSSAAAGDEGPLKLLTSGRLPSPAVAASPSVSSILFGEWTYCARLEEGQDCAGRSIGSFKPCHSEFSISYVTICPSDRGISSCF